MVREKGLPCEPHCPDKGLQVPDRVSCRVECLFPCIATGNLAGLRECADGEAMGGGGEFGMSQAVRVLLGVNLVK